MSNQNQLSGYQLAVVSFELVIITENYQNCNVCKLGAMEKANINKQITLRGHLAELKT